jgi:hypothetical protein
MNKQEAKEIAAKHLASLRSKPYAELIKMITEQPLTSQVRGVSGVLYNLEIQAFWDGKPNANIRMADGDRIHHLAMTL